MMKRLLLTVMAVALVGTSPGGAGQPNPVPAAPKLDGLDYRAFVREFMKPLGAGEASKTLDYLVSRCKVAEAFERQRPEQEQRLAALYQNAGHCNDFEVLGVKHLTGRLGNVYSVAYFERVTVVFMSCFEKTDDGWKLIHWGFGTRLDELEKITPLQRLTGAAGDARVGDLDCRGFLKSFFEPLAKGDYDKALDFVEDNAREVDLVVKAREDWRRKLRLLYRTAGKYEGYELVGLKRLSSRLCKAWVAVYFQKGLTVFTFDLERREEHWKINAWGGTGNLGELDQLAALEVVRDGK